MPIRDVRSTYISRKFMRDHVCMIHISRIHERTARTIREIGKPIAEEKFMRRQVKWNTVLCMSEHDLIKLALEVKGLQRRPDFEEKFEANEGLFRSHCAYFYFLRGGPMRKGKMRAHLCSEAHFEYGLEKTDDGIYVLNHYEGIAS